MLVWFVMVTSDDKQYNQLNIIAHKLAKGERMGYDLLTEESLKQIDQSILADTLLSSYVLNYPNVKNQEIKVWLRKKHFYDLWAAYIMQIDVQPYNNMEAKNS